MAATTAAMRHAIAAVAAATGGDLKRLTMTHTITIHPSAKQFSADADQTVLQAALDAGIALPYGCRNGACRSCRAHIVEGSISYPDGPPKALTPLDEPLGYALLCAAVADCDTQVEVHEIDSHEHIVVRDLPVRVAGKRRLAPDVTELTLQLRHGDRLQFLAGQYVDILLRDGRRRAFSIASPPGLDDHIVLQIRQVPGGDFSSFIADHLKARAILRVRGPLGSFYLRKDDPRPAILMAGGTGFAPIQSMLEDAIASGHERPMHLFWGARARADLYQHELALGWAEQYAHIHYTPVLSEPAEGDAWPGATGFVHQAVCDEYAELGGHVVYMSGPPVMVDAGREAFVARGLAWADVHADTFDYAYETGHDVT